MGDRLLQGICVRHRRFTETLYSASDLIGFSWFTGLDEQLEPVELVVEHAFNSWCHLLESALDKSTDTIGELNASVVAVAGQLPRQASGKTRRLQRTQAS